MNLLPVINYIVNLVHTDRTKVMCSFASAAILNLFMYKLKIDQVYVYLERRGVADNILFLSVLAFISGVFILVDMITGIIAYKSLNKNTKIESNKLGKTVGKFFGLFLFYSISATLIFFISSNFLMLTMIFGIIILATLREFISIGENIEKKWGDKPYIFSSVERLFDIIELKFFNSIKNRNKKS